MEGKFLIKHKIKRLLSFFYVAEKLNNKLVILTYHSVNPGHLYSVKPEEFEKQIKYISENFTVISLNEFNPQIKKEKPFIAITFDDGYEDNYSYAFPVLKKYKVPATIFITTGFAFENIDISGAGDGYFRGLKPLKQEQIKEMDQNNIINFGAHTVTHPRLSELKDSKLEKEIKGSKDVLEKFLNKEVSLFAYPFGGNGDFNENTISVVKSVGYKMAFNNVYGFNDLDNLDLFSLNRVNIGQPDTFGDFKAKINGEWRFLKYLNR